MTKTYIHVLRLFMIFLLLAPFEVMSQDSGGTTTSAKFTKEELAQMVAPIALYPDSLVAQILMSSTYPLEVVQADRWVKQNPNLKGDALDKALKEKAWDVSVKSLCHFPDVLSAMSQNLDQTTKLGDAFLNQQKDVMDTIQELRAKAQAEGNLKTTEQQKVIVEQKYIVIEPANPQVIYVPTYNPAVVYGPWWYPAYPPYAWYPGAAVVGGVIGFGIGYAVGASVGSWSNCNWGHSNINVNYNQTNNFNRVNINDKVGNQNWRHNVDHRRGVAYRDNATSQRFGQSPARSLESRQARGYGDSGFQKQGLEQGKLGQGVSREGSMKGVGERQGLQQGKLKQGGSRESAFKGSIGGGGRDSAFSGTGNGKSTRMASERGRSSLSKSFGGGGFGGGGVGGGSFGGGGYGSVHNSGGDYGAAKDWSSGDSSANRSEYQQNRQDWSSQNQQNRQDWSSQNQQNRQDWSSQNQQNRQNAYDDHWDDYWHGGNYWYGGGAGWSGYYAGLALGTGIAVGVAVASIPAAYSTVYLEGNPFYYSNGVYYAPQGTQYVIVPPPNGAVVSTLPASCTTVFSETSVYSDCGGAFYAIVENGYKVIPPPIGVTVTSLPNGAQSTTVNGNTYFTFGGAYYQPFYSGSDVVYIVVKDPTAS